MARSVSARREVVLEPGAALALWSDVRRWAAFVEGFARYESVDDAWPQVGAKVVWHSSGSGRGRVTEKVTARDGTAFETRVFEERLTGAQRAEFAPAQAGGAHVGLTLTYELTSRAPVRFLADFLFIRPALRSSLERTLRAFAVEAEEEAGLR